MNNGSMHCPICTLDTPHSHDWNKWIGVDFDGTLAFNVENRSDPYILGEPVPAMVNRVKDWLLKGYKVKLVTARMCSISHTTGQSRDLVKMTASLDEWCLLHIGRKLELTDKKDGLMEVLWDDRAVRVVKNTGMPVVSNSAELAASQAEVARLKEGAVCGDCDGSGWLENRVEGRYPCTCMTEAEPYQLMKKQLATARAEIEELRKDAERYRWLRNSEVGPAQIWELLSDDCQPPYTTLKSMHDLDAAIDAARKEGEGNV